MFNVAKDRKGDKWQKHTWKAAKGHCSFQYDNNAIIICFHNETRGLIFTRQKSPMHKVNLDWKVTCVYADANTTDAVERHRDIVYIRNYEAK